MRLRRVTDRLEYFSARWTGHLPERLQLLLCGQSPLVVEGERFDTHSQLILTLRRQRHSYGLTEPNLDAARKRYRRETAVFRGPVTEVGSVRELTIDGPGGALRIRHYAPPATSRDATVYLHGGGFAIGDLDTHDEPCRILCTHAGVHILSVDYRLAPENPFPAAVEDAQAALRWTQTHAETLGVDAKRVSVGGDSAGANLATVTARHAETPPIAQLLIYPTVDPDGQHRSRDLFGEGYFLTMRDHAQFRALYTQGTSFDDSDPRISPLRAPLERMPPVLIVLAAFDLLRDEGEAYAQALTEAGNVVRSLRISALGHGFIHMTGTNQAARRAMKQIASEWRSLLKEAA